MILSLYLYRQLIFYVFTAIHNKIHLHFSLTLSFNPKNRHLYLQNKF